MNDSSRQSCASLTCFHDDVCTRPTDAGPVDRNHRHIVGRPTHQPSRGALVLCGVTVQALTRSRGDDGGVVLSRDIDVPGGR